MSLECIVANELWHAQQQLKFGPISLTIRMTVVRLRDGSLWVHSPISPTSSLIEELRRVGRVRYVIAPNKSHHLFFLEFLNCFPDAEGFIADGLQLKRKDLAQYPRIPRAAPWHPELQGYFIEGLPVLNETVWFHSDTGTLIVSDLLFCLSATNRGLTAIASKLLGVHGKLGMSRRMKIATKNKQALKTSVSPLLSLPVQRVIVAHDQIVDEQPAAKLLQAFAWLQ
jgi:Domain of unknown function (DUF4336)